MTDAKIDILFENCNCHSCLRVWHAPFFKCLIISYISKMYVPDPNFKAGVWHGVLSNVLNISAI